ncbi:protein FAM222A [Trichomycterus rosablanca]|uniref:protein FAM222A n=1 Tax=Trichomycterus rosablanca TaxID=2290929 RepID=UPI002F353FEE
MLACLPRRQNQPTPHTACAAKILDIPVSQKSDLSAMESPRYPSAADLDAYAQKTADSPLSIKIFPSNIRVPQHKQIGRTVNGLDTTGQRYSHYSQPYTGGYQGLLTIVRAPTVTKGIVKSSEGKRTKLSPIQMAVAPYAPPSSSGLAHRHRHRPYNMELCKPPEVHNVPVPPNIGVPASATSLSSGQSLALAPHADHTSLGMVRHMARTANAQGIRASGDEHSSPSHQAATACLDSSFSMDMAKTAGYVDTMEYAIWQSKQQRHQQQQKQHYQQVPLHRYSTSGSSRGTISRSPEVCLPPTTTQIPYRSHALSTCIAGGTLDRVGSSPLNCAPTHGEFSTGQFFMPPWNSTLTTPNSDCYNPQELPPGSMGLGHSHARPQRQTHCVPQQYPDLGLCCGLPGRCLCQASLLSSSLQSLECLISEIHPPCIKERMLGRGYEIIQPTHIQLPVFR